MLKFKRMKKKIVDSMEVEIQKALMEIEGIGQKYDLGIHVVLSSKTQGAFSSFFPKWCGFMLWNKDKFRLKIANEKQAQWTVNLVANFSHLLSEGASEFKSVMKMLETKLEITHGEPQIVRTEKDILQ